VKCYLKSALLKINTDFKEQLNVSTSVSRKGKLLQNLHTLKLHFLEETLKKTRTFKWFLKAKSLITSEDVELLGCCFLTLTCILGVRHTCSAVSTGRYTE
jgi:hypothetical protein